MREYVANLCFLFVGNKPVIGADSHGIISLIFTKRFVGQAHSHPVQLRYKNLTDSLLGCIASIAQILEFILVLSHIFCPSTMSNAHTTTGTLPFGRNGKIISIIDTSSRFFIEAKYRVVYAAAFIKANIDRNTKVKVPSCIVERQILGSDILTRRFVCDV